ncbi:MAG: RNA polymerase sigma factor RpoE [Gammaproteobacteria bacterium]|nr:RNA polymerase sigma factor RpoE [Gammaproteobacteria bacterium]
MGEQTTDQDLVTRVQAGDKRAFDLLVLKYQNRIVKLASRFVHDPMEAQDVAQEAFIKAYRAIGSFRGDSAFYTWLYRITTNVAKNYLVSQKRRPPATGVDAMEAEQYAVDTRLKEKETPENLVVTEELKAAIFRTIEALPDDLKEAITLREIECMSYEDIAIIMDCPVGTVRSRIFRARDAIDQKIAPLMN